MLHVAFISRWLPFLSTIAFTQLCIVNADTDETSCRSFKGDLAWPGAGPFDYGDVYDDMTASWQQYLDAVNVAYQSFSGGVNDRLSAQQITDNFNTFYGSNDMKYATYQDRRTQITGTSSMLCCSRPVQLNTWDRSTAPTPHRS